MQKKIIALAIAGLASTAAFAQTNVTVYGVADACFSSMKASGKGATANDITQTDNGVNSGCFAGSRIGFRGTEDLGNGLKAVFVMENAVNLDSASDSGNATFGGRQAYVGVQTAVGTISLGRQYAPGYYVGNYDALAAAGLISPQSVLSAAMGTAGAGATITPNSDARINNAVAYLSPNWNGVSVRAIYGTADRLGDASTVGGASVATGAAATVDPWNNVNKKDSVLGMSLGYANGPLDVAYIYNVRKDGAGTVTTPTLDKWKEHFIGASYDLGVVALKASYQTLAESGSTFLASGDRKAKLYNIGVVAPVSGAGKVHLAYGSMKEDMGTLADGKGKVTTLAYTHGLSKRTTAYAGYTERKDDTVGVGVTGVADMKLKGYLVGLSHAF